MSDTPETRKNESKKEQPLLSATDFNWQPIGTPSDQKQASPPPKADQNPVIPPGRAPEQQPNQTPPYKPDLPLTDFRWKPVGTTDQPSTTTPPGTKPPGAGPFDPSTNPNPNQTPSDQRPPDQRPPDQRPPDQRPSEPQRPPGQSSTPVADYIDLAVQKAEKEHKEAAAGHSILGGAVHNVSDTVTHAFGGPDSGQSMQALKKLQDEYHDAKKKGNKTDKHEEAIFKAIAEDKSAQQREDTNAGYGSEFVKAVSLFAPGKWGRVAAGATFGLDNVHSNSGGLLQAGEFGLGFGKGYALSTLFGKLGQTKLNAPMQGITLGFASHGLEMATDLKTYKDKGGQFSLAATIANYKNDLVNPHQLVTDAAVFTLAHGMFKYGNLATNNALERNPVLGKMYMAGSFGLVNDTTGEVRRQIQENGSVTDLRSVFEHAIVGTTINALAGGITGGHVGPRRSLETKIADGTLDPQGNRISTIRDQFGNEIKMNMTGNISFKDLDSTFEVNRKQARTKDLSKVLDPNQLDKSTKFENTDPKYESNKIQPENGPKIEKVKLGKNLEAAITRDGPRVIEVTNARGERFQFEYNGWSDAHPVKVTFPDGGRAEQITVEPPRWQEYDAAGNKTAEHGDIYKVLDDGSLMRYNEDANYRITTWRVDGGKAEAKGVEEIVTMPDGTQTTHASPMFLVRQGNVAPEFVERMDRFVQSLPLRMREKMQEAGQKIVIGESVTDVRPHLKGVRPRGWKPGDTWSMADGLFDGDVVVARALRRSNGNLETSNRSDGVLRHEAGHGLDVALGENGVRVSDTPEFMAAHQADWNAMPAHVRASLEYMIQEAGGQPTGAGRSEAFAELSGIGLGGGAADWLKPDMVKYFPRTNKVVQDTLAKYR